MAKQKLTPLRLIARMNFSLKSYSCELLNLTRTVGKVESFQLLQQLFAKAGMWATNTLGVMLEILNNYPWTRLSVTIIGVIKRQFFFHMVTHVFDNSYLSQEIFAIDTWEAVICSLGDGRKHVLTILPTIWRPGFTFLILRYDITSRCSLLISSYWTESSFHNFFSYFLCIH